MNYQKKVNRIFLIMLMMTVANPIKAADGFEDALKFIGGVVFIVGTSIGCGYALRGNDNKVERMKAQTALQAQQQALQQNENKQKHEDALHFLFRLSKKYEQENNLFSNGSLIQKDFETLVLQYADRTPFCHVEYASQVTKDLNQLYDNNKYFDEHAKKDAHVIELLLKKIQQTHAQYFKTLLAQEVVAKQEALAKQQVVEIQLATERQKYAAEEARKAGFEQQAQLLSNAAGAVAQSAHITKQTCEALIQEKREILATIRAELYSFGASKLEKLSIIEDKIIGLHKTAQANQTILKELRADFTIIITEMKKNGVAAHIIDKLEKIIAQGNVLELTLANMAAKD